MDNLIDLAIEYVKDILGKDVSGHDDFHTFRVYKQAMIISKSYGVNERVVALAALLHDLDDPKISKDTSYALDFLTNNNVEEKSHILNIIENMSFSSHKLGKKVTTLEGKIVQDADRLDALGAVGIARVFAYSGYKNRPIYKGDTDDDSSVAHFYQKLFKLPELMNTEYAKKIALDRVKYMKNYLDRLYSEWI